MKRIASLAALLAASASSFAISSFTLTTNNPNWFFQGFVPDGGSQNLQTYGTGTFNSGTSANFSGADYWFMNWFWYRTNAVAGNTAVRDGREFPLTKQNGSTVANPSATVRYLENAASFPNTLQFNLQYNLIGVDADSGIVKVDWSVTNTSTVNSVDLSFFSYSDIDVKHPTNGSGTTSNSATYNNGIIDITGPVGAGTFQIESSRAPSHWKVAPATADRFALADTSTITTLNDQNTLTTGDFAAAYQWDLSLAAGATQGGSLFFRYNPEPVPEPATLAALGIGAVALLRRRRRKN